MERRSTRKLGNYKFLWMGCDEDTAGVGILVEQRWIEKVLEVKRVSEQIIALRVRIGKTVLNLISVYAPQVGRELEAKEE